MVYVGSCFNQKYAQNNVRLKRFLTVKQAGLIIKWDVIEKAGLFEDPKSRLLHLRPGPEASCTDRGVDRRMWVSTFDLGWYILHHISHKQPLWTAAEHSWMWIWAAVSVNTPVVRLCFQGGHFNNKSHTEKRVVHMTMCTSSTEWYLTRRSHFFSADTNRPLVHRCIFKIPPERGLNFWKLYPLKQEDEDTV